MLLPNPTIRVVGFSGAAFLILLLLSPTVVAQQQQSIEPLQARSATLIPTPPEVEWIQDIFPLGEPISDEEQSRRIARLYARYAEVLHAEAEGDAEAAHRMLDGAIRDLRQLAMRPGVAEHPRFRELYRSLLTEYERVNGPIHDLTLDQGDIFELRHEMFAGIDNIQDPLLEDVILPRSVMATFPMTYNRAVEGQIQFYMRNRTHVARVRQRAETYFPMIEQILREEGVPDELKYLAVIESALNPTARSWAGAAGMWQFIPATGRASGLIVTNELDERLDPERATRAAARHLVELYEMFGDWQLAIAGYNCNPAVIRREVARAEQRLGRPATFWDIWNNIPRETRGYIPTFIAISLLMSNPDAFNLADAASGPVYQFDVMPVRGGTSLSSLAENAGTDLATIQALNPSLRRNTVPNWADGYEVRIPAGHFGRHQHRLAAFMPGNSAQLASAHTVSYQGQNRRAIAYAEVHTPGQPRPTDSAIPVQQVADGLTNGRSVAPDAPAASSGSSSGTQTTVYRVRRGDTLSHIARRNGVTVNQLRQWNNIRGSTIRIGQRLTIHRPAGARS